MKFYGRIILVCIALSLTFVQLFVLKVPLEEQIIDTIVSVIIAWFVGKQYDKMRFYAEMDFLTKIYNRRFALRIFPKLKYKVDKSNQNLGVFLIDINNFKCLNDTYGHIAGDEALKSISNLITRNIRNSDILVRWGGDEFLILAPSINENHAINLISRINQHLKTEIEMLDKKDVSIGLAIGYAIYPSDGKNIDELIHLADKKMYINKNESK